MEQFALSGFSLLTRNVIINNARLFHATISSRKWECIKIEVYPKSKV